MGDTWSKYQEMRAERNRTVRISYNETGEVFEIKKKVANPLIAALRAYQNLKEDAENRSNDLKEAARILLILSEIN